MRRAIILLLALLAASGCALHPGQPRTDNVLSALKEQFNRDRGVPRLVVLVSPT
jgi:hypothetical protein